MKIVITGKPEVGKTTLVHIMECEFSNRVLVGLDAFDVMRTGLFPESKTEYGRKCRQRALYHMQVEIENITSDKAQNRLTICDRGTLDCLQDWPGSAEEFFQSVHTSLGEELARYDWVLQINGVAGMRTSQLDFGGPLDPADLWKFHRHYLAIPSKSSFSNCCQQTAGIVRKILQGHSYEEIQEDLLASSLVKSKSSPLHRDLGLN